MKILLLGATSPIARALAMRFAERGARIYAAARDAAEVPRVAADIAVRSGAGALWGIFDAADFASHREFLERAIRELGGLDGVLLCFGTLGHEARALTDPGEALSLVNQNYAGAVSILTLAARYLEEQGRGFIVVLGSVAGVRGRARNYVYGSAKGGLHLFTQGLRARLSRQGVHVMTVILGTVDTRMTWGREGTLLTVAPERAAASIFRAWEKKRDVVYVPWFWRPIMGVVMMIPERLFKRTNF
jgi:decaprenylphospho-beta-D-erythro-pentofuranosid-2-ulose 2-reductase